MQRGAQPPRSENNLKSSTNLKLVFAVETFKLFKCSSPGSNLIRHEPVIDKRLYQGLKRLGPTIQTLFNETAEKVTEFSTYCL